MELGNREVDEATADTSELDFDPDKLIGGSETKESDAPAVNPEAVLHDPEQLAQPVEGLAETRQDVEQLDNGNTVFDHPQDTGELLNSNQGEAVQGFEQTCGLVSAENIARLAGKDVSEADVVGIACVNGDCENHRFFHVADNGAATSGQIVDVLRHLGIDAKVDRTPAIDKLAGTVESGRGVIACVEVSRFWENYPFPGGHAVTLTSVERAPDGKVVAFYVCDSGTGGEDSCRRVDADTLSSALREAVVTEKPIW